MSEKKYCACGKDLSRNNVSGVCWKCKGFKTSMGQNAVDPTPQQIAQQCLEIQSGWTETERAHRAGCFANEIPGEIRIPTIYSLPKQ